MFLPGCKGNYVNYKDGMKSTNQANALIGTSYFETKAKRDVIVMEKLGAAENDVAMVLYAQQASQTDAKVAAMFKAQSLAVPTTGYDIANTFFGSTLNTLAKFGFGYLLGSEIVDGLTGAGAVSLGGSGNTNYLNSMNKGAYNTGGAGNMETLFQLPPELEADIVPLGETTL
jgi:hypothetical protein